MPTNNFKVGEMIPKRTPNSKTWMNFDGSYTTEIFQGHVHYEDEQGNLHNINTDLYDEADFDIIEEPVNCDSCESFKRAKEVAKAAKKMKVLNREQYGFRGLKVPFDVKIPRNFKKGYSIGKGQDRLSFIPVGSSPSKGELHTSDRSTITYQDVWNDADVELKVLPDGLKETIILKTDRAPSFFSFEVKGKEMSENLSAGQLKLSPAWLVDAEGTERDVEQVIIQENNKTYVQLSADVEGLVYPIEIDPTVTIQPSTADTWVQSNTPSTNFENSLGIKAGYYNPDQLESLLKFNLTSIPSGAVVTNATLDLFQYNADDGGSVSLRAHRIISDWSQNLVNWSNKPAYANDGDSQVSISTFSTGVISFPVTNILNSYLDGLPMFGFALKFASASGSGYIGWFRSVEHSTVSERPKLTITYNTPPTAPSIITPNGGETWNSFHTITWDGGIDPDGTPDVTSGTTSNFNAPYSTAGQQFTATKTGKLNKVDIMFNKTSNFTVTLSLYSLNASGLPETVLYTETFTKNLISGDSFYEFVFTNPPSVANGTKYGLVINTANLKGTTAGTYSTHRRLDFNGSVWMSNSNNYNMKFYFSPGATLSYQIQLTTNNGGAWKDIVALTAAGATSYAYDFINEAETSTAKVRIRAYDGTDYGQWDESDGVFTIQHNQAPAAPINLSPAGGQARDRAAPVRLSWLHNDPNAGDPQSKFDLQWRSAGTTTWNDVSDVTANQYYDLSGLPYGSIEWRVRTYDQAELPSPYSDIAVFLAGNKPTMPTITNYSDGATVAVATPLIQWSSSGQSGYRLQVKNTGGAIVWEDERTSTNKAVTANAGLENEEYYSFELSIRNSDGLWSDPHVINVWVSYTPPAVPTLSISGNGYAAKIELQITNPDPVGTEPTVTHHDVFRRKSGETAWTRIANNVPLNGTFTDHMPGHDLTYQYYVKAYGNNETYRNSGTVSESISLQSIWLMDPDDTGSLYHFEYFEPGRSAERMFNGQVTMFEGRAFPMAEFSPRQQSKVNVILQIERESDDLAALHDLLSRQTTLLYRDAKGRRMFGVIFMLPETETDWGYNVPIEFIQVNYEEDV